MSPAEELAEVPATTVLDRLVAQIHDITLLLDTTDAVSFAADEPWDALAALRVSAEKLAEEAELHR